MWTHEATNDDDTGARLTSSILRSGDRPSAASMATLDGETPAKTSKSETIRVSGAVKVGMSVLARVSKRGSPWKEMRRGEKAQVAKVSGVETQRKDEEAMEGSP